MKALMFVCALLVAVASNCFAAHEHVEEYYNKIWCQDHNGTPEVLLRDGTRADCVTDDDAIEFEFAHKWAESVGQSLHYGALLKKRPGIVLILEKPDEIRFMNRLQETIQYFNLPIYVWKIEVWNLK